MLLAASAIVFFAGGALGALLWRERSRLRHCEHELQEAERALDGLLADRGDISELRRRALSDHLTGLGNRVLFEDRLQLAAVEARRSGASFGLLYMDLDGFKGVNDSLGHAAGDQLLKVVAQRIQRSVREADTVCRLGGDEFAVVLYGQATMESLDQVRAKLESAVAQPIVLEGRAVKVGSSIGAALYPGGSADERELVKAADSAMYRAKQARKASGTAARRPSRPVAVGA